MAYTFGQVAVEMIEVLKSIPEMKIQYKVRENAYQIKYKVGNRYVSAQKCFDKMIAVYENRYGKKVNWEFFPGEIHSDTNHVKMKRGF